MQSFLKLEYVQYVISCKAINLTPMSFREWINLTYEYEYMDQQ